MLLLTPIITSSHIVTSDYCPICTSINVRPNPPPPTTTFTYRRISTIDYPIFVDDLNSSSLITNPPCCLPDLPDSFFVTLRSLLDDHASFTKTNQSSLTAFTSWITNEILSLKSARRRLECTYIVSHSVFYLKLLRSATNRYHKFIAATKKSYYASLVQSSSKPRALSKTINNILHRTANRSLLTSSPLAALPQLYAAHFSDKISKLHLNLQTNPSSTQAHYMPPLSLPFFHSITPATLLEIDNLLSQSSDSYCDLNPVPTTVLIKISNAISPTILSIVNLSITTGTFYSTFKSSIISPLLKNLHSITKICLITGLVQTSPSPN